MSSTLLRRYDCDGCGAVADVTRPGADAPSERDLPPGWRRMAGDRHACEACCAGSVVAFDREFAAWAAVRDAFARPAYAEANAAYTAAVAPVLEWEAANPRPVWRGTP